MLHSDGTCDPCHKARHTKCIAKHETHPLTCWCRYCNGQPDRPNR